MWTQDSTHSLICIDTWNNQKEGYEFLTQFYCCSVDKLWLSMTPWTAAHQASLSSTVSWSLLKFMSIESVMLCNHLIHCHLFSFCIHSSTASGSFPMSQLIASGGQSTGASASVLPMNIWGWFPLVLTGLISLQFKGLSRVFSSTTIWKHPFFGSQPSLWSSSYIHTWLLEKPQLWLYGYLSAKWCLCFLICCLVMS